MRIQPFNTGRVANFISVVWAAKEFFGEDLTLVVNFIDKQPLSFEVLDTKEINITVDEYNTFGATKHEKLSNILLLHGVSLIPEP